jgi:hypothetical protein
LCRLVLRVVYLILRLMMSLHLALLLLLMSDVAAFDVSAYLSGQRFTPMLSLLYVGS